jgi:uncharacterized protein YheU (UPF0270 family)
MIIDHTQLTADTLKAIIEAFINRGDHTENTTDINLPDTIKYLKYKLDQQELYLTFDAATESVNILDCESVENLSGLIETE